MLILIQILVIVYYISINVYSFLLLRSQKKAEEEGDCNKVRDGSLFITALLGGALGIYVAMFVLKFRTRSLFLMVFMPVIVVCNLYFLIIGYVHDFWVFNGTFYKAVLSLPI
ncbi:MAG: DUF1294 domain-containing protein [Clostridiales bacterium]|nr:DUF1294 domain-containing protein [Clostridiales bacterium]